MGPQPGATAGHILSRLADYYSGGLTAEHEMAVEAHLLRCAACRLQFDALGDVALLVATLAGGPFDIGP